jgi:hypothetical protein
MKSVLQVIVSVIVSVAISAFVTMTLVAGYVDTHNAAEIAVLKDAVVLEGRLAGLENHMTRTEQAIFASLVNHKAAIEKLVDRSNMLTAQVRQLLEERKPEAE